ncbi:MAG: hypothetical protein K1X88_15610 [Nannocystaceae bacterium]|nr:hypothetical protein [Nannocystaceae bacterium]
MLQLSALVRTLGVELLLGSLLLPLLVRRGGAGISVLRGVTVLLGVNLATHPLAWWCNRALASWLAFEPRAAVIEAAVIAVESLAFARLLPLPWPRALALAAAINLASFGFGLWWMMR